MIEELYIWPIWYRTEKKRVFHFVVIIKLKSFNVMFFSYFILKSVYKKNYKNGIWKLLNSTDRLIILIGGVSTSLQTSDKKAAILPNIWR